MEKEQILDELNLMIEAQTKLRNFNYKMHKSFLSIFYSKDEFEKIEQSCEKFENHSQGYEEFTDFMKQTISELVEQKGIDYVLEKIATSNQIIYINCQTWFEIKQCALTSKIIRDKRQRYLDCIISNILGGNSQLPEDLYFGDPKILSCFLTLPYKYRYSTEKPTETKFSDIFSRLICDRYFDDTEHNVLINLDIIEKFYNKPEYKQDIEKFDNSLKQSFEKLIEINQLLKIQDSLDKNTLKQRGESKINFITLCEKLKDDNYCSVMYDCISAVKNTVSKLYKQSCSKPSDFPKLLHTSRHSILDKCNVPKNIDVRDITNMPFKFFITSLSEMRTDNIKIKDLNRRSGSDVSSTTFIGDECTNSFNSLQSMVTFVYYDFDQKDLVMINDKDNINDYTRDKLNGVTSFPFCILTPDEMLKKCKENNVYNECNFHFPSSFENQKDILTTWRKTSIETPQAILCLNQITPLDIKLAEKYKIPLFYKLDYSYRYIRGFDETPDRVIYDRPLS